MSGSVPFHPRDVPVHPALQEFPAARTDVAVIVKQAILYLDECFGLAKRRHVQSREHVAQMLLCHGRAGGAGRSAQQPCGLADPGALAIGAREVR